MFGRVAAICLASLSAASAQTPGSPSFEVASVRPTQALPDDWTAATEARKNYGLKLSGSQVLIRESMAQLIAYAYSVPFKSMCGLPDRTARSYFEIHALIPDNASARDVPAMTRKLLHDRFNLTSHDEDVPQQGYALMVGKGPLKLNEARDLDLSSCSDWREGNNPDMRQCSAVSQENGRRVVTSINVGGWLGPVRTVMSRRTDGADPDTITTREYYRITMPKFAEILSGQCPASGGCIGATVEDRTGIDGERDLVMEKTCSRTRARVTHQLFRNSVSNWSGQPFTFAALWWTV